MRAGRDPSSTSSSQAQLRNENLSPVLIGTLRDTRVLVLQRSVNTTPSLRELYLIYFVLPTTITTLLRGAQIDLLVERHLGVLDGGKIQM